MPRGRLKYRTRRARLEALHFKQVCHDTRVKRRAVRETQRLDEMRRKTYGWLDLRPDMEGAEIEADMADMELRLLNADRRKLGLPPIDFLPSDGGIGDTCRPQDDWRNYE